MARSAVTVIIVFLLATGSLAQTQTLPDLIVAIKPSVAFVSVAMSRGRASGTAFTVLPAGLLATALHVVDDAQEISVVLSDGTRYQADVVAANSDFDLAALRISRTELRALPLASPTSIRQGEEVVVVGYPLASTLGNYEMTVTRGVVSAIRSQTGLIQVDAAMNPGVSGGPVINLRGEVIGVAVHGLRAGQQVNFASPSTAVSAMLNTLAGRPVAELSKLRTPMVGPREVPLEIEKGLSASQGGTELGVSCTIPPAGARGITAVRGSLSVPGNLLAITWLSFRRGVEIADQGAFAHLLYDNRVDPQYRERRLSFATGNLDGPPEPVCLNYSYRTEFLCITCMFSAKYVVEYRVRSVTVP